MTKVKAKPTKKQKQKNKKVNKIKKNIMQVALLSSILFLVIFIAYQIIKLAVHPTNSFLIEQGEIMQAETVVGYVIRDEKVMQNLENTGNLVQIKNEGEKTSLGEEVFRYEAINEKQIDEKIKNLNIQIQEAMEGQTKRFSSDIKALEKQIESKIIGIQDKNNIQEIKEYKTDINSYIVKKAKIAGELSPSGSYINNLITERTELEKQLKQTSKYVQASIAGIVSYRIDGLEEKLIPENFEELSVQMLENLNLTTGQIVSSSDKMGKVINNFECYIAVSTNTEEAQKAKIGDKISIKLSASQEIPAKIEYIKEEKENRLIVFKITQSVENLISYRKVSLDLIWWQESGLRIPNTSIIYENGLSYVIRTKAGDTDKILVKIIKENNNDCIITNYKTEELKNMGYTAQEINDMRKISIYDEILTNPDL